jgi:hypothetical protein
MVRDAEILIAALPSRFRHRFERVDAIRQVGILLQRPCFIGAVTLVRVGRDEMKGHKRFAHGIHMWDDGGENKAVQPALRIRAITYFGRPEQRRREAKEEWADGGLHRTDVGRAR